jgi:hypothetical protein
MAIETEVTERGMTVSPQAAGTRALAMLSDAEFERQLTGIRQGQQRIARMQKELLIEGVDYGNVPGVDKPSLGKPGAEKLGLAYSLAARVETRLSVGDGLTSPTITYDATCHLHLGTFDGPEVGVGHGSCNSWESKYRWRNQERLCPTCGKPAIVAGKAEYGGGWLCFKKRGGCGAKFGTEDPRVTGQQVGREENPEPWDLANTLMKMAEKRAHVDSILRTTAASGIFTQDLEDNVVVIDVTPAAAPKAAAPAQRGTTEPPPISDAELASMGSGMPQRATPAGPPPAAPEEIEGEAIEVPPATGLSASALAGLAVQGGKTKGQLAVAIGAISGTVPAPTDVTAAVTAMSDEERGRLADELKLTWRTA